MDVDKLVHRNEGVGHDSYANNSLIQKSSTERPKSILQESTKKVYHALKPKCFMMVDTDCSSGINALFAVSEIINAIDEACRSLNCQVPEFGVFLSDLSENDFNTLFNFLQGFYKQVEEKLFVLNKLETFTVDRSIHTNQDLDNQAEFLVGFIRATCELLLPNAFGKAIMDDLFVKFKIRVFEHTEAGRPIDSFLLVSVTRKT